MNITTTTTALMLMMMTMMTTTMMLTRKLMTVVFEERDRRQIVVARNICESWLFIGRMPKMCTIPQLVSAPLNLTRAIPIVEHFSRCHPQCEHNYWQGIWVWVWKQPLWQRKCKKLNNGLHDVHFKIAGDSCDLIGSQQCDLFNESHY